MIMFEVFGERLLIDSAGRANPHARILQGAAAGAM
jgi:hypothetical protein